jgi:hypothetical protein
VLERLPEAIRTEKKMERLEQEGADSVSYLDRAREGRMRSRNAPTTDPEIRRGFAGHCSRSTF